MLLPHNLRPENFRFEQTPYLDLSEAVAIQNPILTNDNNDIDDQPECRDLISWAMQFFSGRRTDDMHRTMFLYDARVQPILDAGQTPTPLQIWAIWREAMELPCDEATCDSPGKPTPLL